MHGGENRGVAFGVAGAFGFAEFLDQVEKIAGEFGFESHDEFLVVEPERISRVEPDGLVLIPNFDVLIHDALAGVLGEQVPLALFHKWVDEDVFVLAGADDRARFIVRGVQLIDVGGAFGLGEKRMGRDEIAGNGQAVDDAVKCLDIIEFERDRQNMMSTSARVPTQEYVSRIIFCRSLDSTRSASWLSIVRC